jgi:tetratricopeptide (TPR) repeat protein
MTATSQTAARLFGLLAALAALSLAPAQKPPSEQPKPSAPVADARPARGRSSSADSLIPALDKAIFSNNGEMIAQRHQPIAEAAAKQPDDYALKIAAAKGYLARADLLRVERHVGKVDADTNAKYREQQADWGRQGAALALEAVDLAADDAQRSEARRLVGECTVHQINGPIAGIRFGPVAKGQIEEALKLDPNNPEAMRAQGLMYLHNPPINGGDLNLAVETFKKVAETNDSDVPRALLAQAWLKRGRPERARLEATRALAFNPNNKLAGLIIAKLDESEAQQ